MAFSMSGPVWPEGRADVVTIELPHGTIRILDSEVRPLMEFAIGRVVGRRQADIPQFEEVDLPQSERFVFRWDDLVYLANMWDAEDEINEVRLAAPPPRAPTIREVWRD